MITIDRLLARQIRSVFRRALGLRAKESTVPIVFTQSDEGLSIHACADGAAIQFRQARDEQANSGPAETLAVTLDLLAACEGGRPTPVTLENPIRKSAKVRWHSGDVPQVAQRDLRGVPGSLPALPETWSENGPELLDALQAAMATTDADTFRYALNTVQLGGQTGTITATDGRQVFRQPGFQFGWDDQVLVRRSTVFGCKELPGDQAVRVGRTDQQVIFVLGPWNIWLAIEKNAKFPRIDQVIPATSDAKTVVDLSPSDAHFLGDNLLRLPGDIDNNLPVTVDLNGAVAIRAKASDQTQPTELVLGSSARSGEDLRLCTDRRFLARAVQLGFTKLHCYGPDRPVLAHDGRRDYVWALLSPELATEPSDHAVRIEAPIGGASSSASPVPIPSRRPRTMTTSETAHQTANQTATPATNGAAARTPAVKRRTVHSQAAPAASPIEAAIGLRTTLREALARTNELVRAIKRQKKQTRLMRATLESLKELQKVA